MLPLRLSAGEIKSFRPRSPRLVSVLAGRVWLTVEGQAQDWVLGPGDSVILPAGALTVAQALTDASFDPESVTAQPPAAVEAERVQERFVV